MVKKCKCKKCGYCKQIFTATSVTRINCEKVGFDMVIPSYCDEFITIEEYKMQQEFKKDYERQIKYAERVWSILEKRGNK